MVAGLTPIYKLDLPDIGGDQDIWGGKLNNNFNKLDTLLNNRLVLRYTTDDPVPAGYQFCQTHLTVAAQAGYPSNSGDMYPTSVTTAAWVEKRIYDILNVYLPPLSIIMWHGKAWEIPNGWALCNGIGGTPNMSDRIILQTGYNNLGQHGAGELAGGVGTGLGHHYHNSSSMVAAGADVYNDYTGIALYSGHPPGGGLEQLYADLPYYVTCYIMKIRYWP